MKAWKDLTGWLQLATAVISLGFAGWCLWFSWKEDGRAEQAG